MPVDVLRPDVGQLMLKVFGRPLHPELLQTCARVAVQTKHYSADLQLCEAGHMICFRYHGKVLCEVACSDDTLLPQKQQVISRRLRGCRNESVEHDAGILYHVSFQVEKVDPEVFLTIHEELLQDCEKSRVSYAYAPQTRLAPPPLSLIQTDERPHSLLIHAFHTYPENLAIVRTQSLFEV